MRQYYKKGGKVTAKRKRNYRHEYDSYHGTEKQRERRAARNKSRRKLEKAGKVRKGDGKDVHHRDRNPGNQSAGNMSVTSQKKNRGWRKGKRG